MGLAGLNIPQSLRRRFQLVEVRLADQYGVVFAATARNDNLPAAAPRDGLKQRKKSLPSRGDGNAGRCHGMRILYK
jgi:hypothetical protein